VAAVDAVDRVTVIAADQDGPESGVDVGPAVVVGAAGTEADGRGPRAIVMKPGSTSSGNW
jgi:hypothetical protein